MTHLTLYLVYLVLERKKKKTIEKFSPASWSCIYTVEASMKCLLGFIFSLDWKQALGLATKLLTSPPPHPLRGECPPWGKLRGLHDVGNTDPSRLARLSGGFLFNALSSCWAKKAGRQFCLCKQIFWFMIAAQKQFTFVGFKRNVHFLVISTGIKQKRPLNFKSLFQHGSLKKSRAAMKIV